MSGIANPNRVYSVGSRDGTPVDLIRALSDAARLTRRPGQTLQARLNELRREIEP